MTRCSAQVYASVGAHRCSREGTLIRGCKPYCYQHDPVGVARHRADRLRKRASRLALARYADRMYDVLRQVLWVLEVDSATERQVSKLLNDIEQNI